MAKKIEKCKNCRFHRNTVAADGYLFCHKSAPAVGYYDPEGDVKFTAAVWPQVEADDWCGEWKPAV